MSVKRGDIYYADLGPFVGCEQGGARPVLIISNDIGNAHGPTVICAAISSKAKRKDMPTHVSIDSTLHPYLSKDSIILFEQIRTIDKSRLHAKVTHLSDEEMRQADKALRISLGVN